MDELELTSAHVFGSSMGATIAQELALEYPDRADSLILSSASYSLEIPETELLRGKLQAIASNPDADPGLRKYADTNLKWNGTYERLPEIQNKVLLLAAKDDILTPAIISVEMAEQLPNAQIVQFEDTGHCVEKYLPVEYADTIIDFLSL